MPKSTFTDAYGRFTRLLVQGREDCGLTQAAVAERLGRPQSFVSKYERGERRLDMIEFLSVADALSLDPCALIHKLHKQRGK